MNQAHDLIRPELLVFSFDQVRILSSHLTVLAGAAIGMVLAVTRIVNARRLVMVTSLATCVAGVVASLYGVSQPASSLFNNMFVVDGFSAFFNAVVLATSGLTILSSSRYLDQEGISYPEYYLLILFSAFGMMVMASAYDLVSLFIGLEIMSLSVYSLVGFRRADRRSNEASLKYFVLGGVASAVLLYGVALLYGATGSTNLTGVAAIVKQGQTTPLFWTGAWLVIVGFLFKVASVPFHMWMPDVYEGAPTPVTGFMTTALKVASFAAFLRVFVAVGPNVATSEILWWFALATMVIGNLLALVQVNVKRMLGYSSIAHTGYLLVGFLAGANGSMGFTPLLVYLVSYSVMNLGAFIVLSQLATRMDGSLNLADFSGLAKRHPWLAFALGVFMFSMAGVPPTAGFMAKYLVFSNAVQAGHVSLVVAGVLCSAISAFYYLRLLVYIYMREPATETPQRPFVWGGALAVLPLAFLSIQLGVLPSLLIELAQRAISSL